MIKNELIKWVVVWLVAFGLGFVISAVFVHFASAQENDLYLESLRSHVQVKLLDNFSKDLDPLTYSRWGEIPLSEVRVALDQYFENQIVGAIDRTRAEADRVSFVPSSSTYFVVPGAGEPV
ncbi:MAG: hypothetical protein GF411_03260, partial [Candidatus Lokiarchaeota archaeon]|nr:hypothetical protein [Candidatus Lokiarchaeota archaeon]